MKYTDAVIAEFIHFLEVSTQLCSLDICGTNLTYIVRHEPHVDKECRGTCMPDFPGRQFEYLGLGMSPECRHKCIPARKVSGVDSPEQLVVSVWSYQHNQAIMGRVLDELNRRLLLNDDAMSTLIVQQPPMVCEMFKGLLAYVEKRLDWHAECFDNLQSIRSLVHCVRSLLQAYNRATNLITSNYLLTVTARRKLLELFLVVITNTVRDVVVDQAYEADCLSMICLLSLQLLVYLDLPNDAVRCYMFEQYIRILCSVVDSVMSDGAKVVALDHIHTACRASQDLKAVICGKIGTTQLLINSVRVRVGKNCDEMLEKLWSVLWALTDEVVPGNCEAFLQHNGREVGLLCLQEYPGQLNLYRKISGAMRNVSECPNLRPQLMTREMITMFRRALLPGGEMYLCFNAVAFLVLLLADGVAAWTVDDPPRDTVVQEVEHTIDGWGIMWARGVRFRSLTSLLIQIENSSEPVALYWGIWVICNRVKVKPERYVPMFQEQRGEDVLHRVQTHPALTAKTRDLITTILADVALYDGKPEADTD